MYHTLETTLHAVKRSFNHPLLMLTALLALTPKAEATEREGLIKNLLPVVGQEQSETPEKSPQDFSLSCTAGLLSKEQLQRWQYIAEDTLDDPKLRDRDREDWLKVLASVAYQQENEETMLASLKQAASIHDPKENPLTQLLYLHTNTRQFLLNSVKREQLNRKENPEYWPKCLDYSLGYLLKAYEIATVTGEMDEFCNTMYRASGHPDTRKIGVFDSMGAAGIMYQGSFYSHTYLSLDETPSANHYQEKNPAAYALYKEAEAACDTRKGLSF